MADRKAPAGVADVLQSRRSLLATLAGAGAVLSLPEAARAASLPTPTDPSFAAIEHHRAAFEAFGAALKADQGRDGPEVEAASEANEGAMHDFLGIEPTTPAGLLAMIEHFSQHLGYGDSSMLELGFPSLAASAAVLLPGTRGAA